MWKYIRRAFLATVRLPLVGRVPFNVIFVALVFAAGVRWRAVWMFGAWLEAAYLLLLAGSPRFQKVVDAEELERQRSDPHLQRQRLIDQLDPPTRARLTQIQNKCDHAVNIARGHGQEEFALQSQRDGLDRLTWLYLKLLLAGQLLNAQGKTTSAVGLRAQCEQLESDLRSSGLAETVRQSKEETLRIIRRRLELHERRVQALAEIEADLDRIEAEVDLAVEHATLGPAGARPSGEVRLATAMLESELFGESQSTVEALDRVYEK
jgi:hypothetical protein